MINLALISEYSFQQAFAKVSDLVESQPLGLGVADFDNTFAHWKLAKFCKEQDKKPVFGVRLMAVRNPLEKVRPSGQYGHVYILLARNFEGLKEIRSLVRKSTECFYYRAHIGIVDIWGLSDNVIVIAESFDIEERIDYLGVSFNTPNHLLKNCHLPRVAINSNSYIDVEDKEVYELISGGKKGGLKTYPQHILTENEWLVYFKDKSAVKNTYKIFHECNVEFTKASPVNYSGKETLEELCYKNAKPLGVDLTDMAYFNRFQHELELIRKKDFEDYFLIVADMVLEAKQSMLVGPARGSAGGSLVCYLSGITTIDPVKHDLLFERFISPDRVDMPDIDIDFPDVQRQKVIKRLIAIYGEERVKQISTITQMKVKNTIREFGKLLCVPNKRIDLINSAISQQFQPLALNKISFDEAMEGVDGGDDFVNEYPEMKLCNLAKDHARNSGIHAAGVIVGKEELINFASIDERHNSLQLDMKDAADIGLLKIDVLGLKTLSILQETAELAGFDYSDYYKLPLDLPEVFRSLNKGLFAGVFQFEGYSLQGLCRLMRIKGFEDITAITALARPGPLHAGASNRFVKVHNGQEKAEMLANHKSIYEITKVTYGQIVYQEQLMSILREIGGMNWEDVNKCRSIIGKSKGSEKLNEFKERFIDGAIDNGLTDESADKLWSNILTFGSYGFNRSHAVAYAMISYWSAWAKTKFPLEFACAYLRHTKEPQPCIKMLREMKVEQGISFVPVDSEISDIDWSIIDGKLYGGLTNIKGIGVTNARTIIRSRKNNKPLTRSITLKLLKSETEFDVLFPCREYWGEIFDHPHQFGLKQSPVEIDSIQLKGDYVFIGRLLRKTIKDIDGEINVNVTLEDDSGTIMGRIPAKKYDPFGIEVLQDGKEEADWYLVKGVIIANDIRFVFINSIYRLGDGINETVDDLV